MQAWLASVPSWLWMVFTLVGAGAQTARNAMQRDLIRKVGTGGATHVRFLYGLPFAALFFVVLLEATGEPLPALPAAYWPWLLAGSVAQVLATALMLVAMKFRSFVVATAYIKTEPVLVALFGLVALGDVLTPMTALAIFIATAGVLVMSLRPGASESGLGPALYGIAGGGCFALAAVCYRGAILLVPTGSFIIASSITVMVTLAVQSALFSLYLFVTDRAALIAVLRLWRPSALAGFFGALASLFWFLAFSLTAAANVRTFALVEVLMAQAVSLTVFRQKTTPREMAGIAAVVVGVALLILAQS